MVDVASAPFTTTATVLRTEVASAPFTTAASALRIKAASAPYTADADFIRAKTACAPFTGVAEFIVPSLISYGINSLGQIQSLATNDAFIDTSSIPVIEATVHLLSNTLGIDSKVVGATTLYTVPAGKQVLVTEVIVKVVTSAAITTSAFAGVGIAAGEDDIIISQALINLIDVDKSYGLDVYGLAAIGNAGDVIKLGVDTAAVGTSQTLDVCLIGLEITL